MPKYILITGQSRDLAQAEIWSVFNKQAKNLEFHPNYCLLELDLDAEQLMNRLGGTIKIAKYLASFDNLNQLTTDWWAKNLDKKDNKINFGFSLYGGQNKKYLPIKKIALSVKKELSAQGYKSRLVTSQELELSSVVVKKNNLLGNELLIIPDSDKYIIGLTQAVQDFEDYAERDMNRPGRDDRSGMLPPKVAKMMVNLLGAETKEILLDPFCGSGTVLQEAVILGYKKLLGTDKSAKAIEDSQKNLAWLKKQYQYSFEAKIIKADAENLSKYLSPHSADYLVSEPFMGSAPEIMKKNNLSYFHDLSQELAGLYFYSFQEFYKILKPGGKIIFVFPIFNVQDIKIDTLDIKRIEKIGFKNIGLPINFKSAKNGQIVYQRPQQKVSRQITIWEKI
ncbi:MAG: methyltransferase domain-containing protein [Patescibacteria group bacterium]|jgi:tRNA G10  N-methylase Trm11